MFILSRLHFTFCGVQFWWQTIQGFEWWKPLASVLLQSGTISHTAAKLLSTSQYNWHLFDITYLGYVHWAISQLLYTSDMLATYGCILVDWSELTPNLLQVYEADLQQYSKQKCVQLAWLGRQVFESLQHMNKHTNNVEATVTLSWSHFALMHTYVNIPCMSAQKILYIQPENHVFM